MKKQIKDGKFIRKRIKFEPLRRKKNDERNTFEKKNATLSLTDGGGYVGGGIMRLLEPVLQMRSDPHCGQWAFSRQKGMRIKHLSLLLLPPLRVPLPRRLIVLGFC